MFGFGDKLELKAKETALVLIDLEHGILAGKCEHISSSELVVACANLAAATRAAGGTVVYVHVLLHEFLQMPADKPMVPAGSPPPPAAASDLVPASGYQAATDILIAKRQWDAFYGTDLKAKLDAKVVKTIVLGGIATNFGVESTARSAIAQGYAVVFAEDAIAGRNEDMHDFAMKNVFPVIGKVSSVKKISEALSS